MGTIPIFLVKIPKVEERDLIVDLPGRRRKDNDCSERSQRRTGVWFWVVFRRDSRRSSWRRPRPWSTRPARVERMIMSCFFSVADDMEVMFGLS